MKRFLFCLTIVFTEAFVVVHRHPNHVSRVKTHDSLGPLEDLEEARRTFEAMVVPTILETRHPLSFAERRRRQLEIQLLRELEHSDEALDQLMDLWIHACPCEAESIDAILLMEYQTTPETENTLKRIISKCPEWPEPTSRLALLKLVKGDYDECQKCVDTVLRLKPWHFEMRQMQILLDLVRHNKVAAIVDARLGLPPMSQPKKRRYWIAQMVMAAELQLDELELDSVESSMLKPSTAAWQ
jgi:hypothetical protein